MSDVLKRCTVCDALIDEEDLFCANCGTEAPHQTDAHPNGHTEIEKHGFTCGGCGASMSYDASAKTLRCPFCGSEKLDAQQDSKSLAADHVVAFDVTQDRALAILRKYLGGSFWRPSDLARRAVIEKLTPVYVPYWVFEATTHTYWTADSSHAPAGSSSGWYPVSGEHTQTYSGLLIGASSALAPNETTAICPFDLTQAVERDRVDLENHVVEQFRVPRKYARPQARSGIEHREREACQQFVEGRSRNLHVNVRLSGLSSNPILLPVWILAYRYKQELFRFIINGQTGKYYGRAPTSYAKIALVIGVGLAILFVFFLLFSLFAALAH